ncbi:MAG: PQQ-binding-like beta-propeller repeat protein [Mucilaginibacter sp.]
MLTISKTPCTKFLLWSALIFLIPSWFSCSKSGLDPTPIPSTSLTGITSVVLMQDTALVHATAVTVGDSILITVPGTTNPNGLMPKISFGNGTTISPASGVSQDFTKPVTYTATLSNGTAKTYVIKVILDKLRNIVYAGSSSGKFFALDAITGRKIWAGFTGGDFSYSSPCMANGIIYAGNINGNMYAYNAALGNVIWTYKAGSSIESSPAVSGNNVYFGSDDHYFYSVNALTGALNWKFQAGFNVGSSPLVYNGTVFFGSDDKTFYALDAISGSVKWTLVTTSQLNASSPVQLNGIVYIGNRDGNFFALDAATGEQKWVFSSNGISFEMARPVIVNGVIYVSSWYNVNNFSIKGKLYALDAVTGTQVWTSLSDIGFTSGPAVADNEVYICGDDGNIYAVAQSSGETLWANSIHPNGAIPTVKDGTIYVGGGGNTFFYALDDISGAIKWTYPASGMNISRPYVIDANGN